MRTPNEDLRRIAQEYNDHAGLGRVRTGHWVEVDPEHSRSTADAYGRLPEYNPKAGPAYRAFEAEVWEQARALARAGYRMRPTREDPYGSSAEMAEAARTKVLRVFESAGDAHVLMNATTNTVFRWVHDLFGHAAEGYSFGPRGEFNAALHHAQMFTPLARLALLTETHGQNSWVNYGPHGEANRANPSATTYAAQKAALLPVPVVAEFHGRLLSL